MKMGVDWCMLGDDSPLDEVGCSWCFEPACQSDPDSAAYPKLSPPAVGEHAEQIAPLLAVFRG
jgi:hypothetical protein